MGRFRQFLQSGPGQALTITIVLVVAGAMIVGTYRGVGGADAAHLSRQGIFIDAMTDKPFNYTIKPGDTIPVRAPSGNRSGYPAEMCYWTRDGQIRDEPFPVLLNHYKNLPEPTFCPDCGRLCKAQSAPPRPGQLPPPTRAEYEQRSHADRSDRSED